MNASIPPINSMPESDTGRQENLTTITEVPTRYLRDAIRIARFDAETMVRVSQDRRALAYGAGVMVVGVLATYASNHLFATRREAGWLLVVLGVVITVLQALLSSIINVAVIHGLARLLFGATGRYVSILRVLWLGSIVWWLGVVPVIGWIASSIWSLMITFVAFEEIDGVERLQALALVLGYAAVMLLIGVMLS